MMWTCQRAADGTSPGGSPDNVMPHERGADAESGAVAETGHEPKDDAPERLQVQDPETGLSDSYDLATHERQVYDPETHVARAAQGDELQRAMALFSAQQEQDE
jgi:hypothetical protein